MLLIVFQLCFTIISKKLSGSSFTIKTAFRTSRLVTPMISFSGLPAAPSNVIAALGFMILSAGFSNGFLRVFFTCFDSFLLSWKYGFKF